MHMVNDTTAVRALLMAAASLILRLIQHREEENYRAEALQNDPRTNNFLSQFFWLHDLPDHRYMQKGCEEGAHQ